MDIALCGRALADSSATSACVAAPADRALAPDFLREIAGSNRSKKNEAHKTRTNATAAQARRDMTTSVVHSTPFQ
jgi:hypothetical protein